MSKLNQLLGASVLTVAFSSAAFAQGPDDHQGNVIFQAEVEGQCGIEVNDAEGKLGFGGAYNADVATITLINNYDKDTEMKLKHIDLGALEDQNVTEDDIKFKSFSVMGTGEGTASEWKEKGYLTIPRDSLRDDNEVDLASTVVFDENNLDADSYQVNTTWEIHCG
ncbi:hypothetical protein F0231_02775 [Vibrio sp. RE86]|uniref:hypothetical protein n=1 Tax=Vibrio sp. RE86 TaxID=2607605 RepID=UPI001493875A|nr:hypothetical protein [Vibrio sp. RE86]NOH78658.1 hypothetical protein [Vibrio sp. RE86]